MRILTVFKIPTTRKPLANFVRTKNGRKLAQEKLEQLSLIQERNLPPRPYQAVPELNFFGLPIWM